MGVTTSKVNRKYVKYSFDLKGSITKRLSAPADSVLKDQNFLKIKEKEAYILFQLEDAANLTGQMALDITLLK